MQKMWKLSYKAKASKLLSILMVLVIINIIIYFNQDFNSLINNIDLKKNFAFLQQNEKKNIKIFCMIMTQPGNFKNDKV